MSHLYKVGQMLDLKSAPRLSNRPEGPCEVLFCLPHDSGAHLYRVKSLGENNERVVDEADLRPSSRKKSALEDGERLFNIANGKR